MICSALLLYFLNDSIHFSNYSLYLLAAYLSLQWFCSHDLDVFFFFDLLSKFAISFENLIVSFE